MSKSAYNCLSIFSLHPLSLPPLWLDKDVSLTWYYNLLTPLEGRFYPPNYIGGMHSLKKVGKCRFNRNSIFSVLFA